MSHRLAVRSFLGGRPALTPGDLAMVLLVREDDDDKPRPMPTVTVREVGDTVKALEDLGIRSVKIFAGSRVRDAHASQSVSPTGLMAQAIIAAKRAAPGVLVMTETCVCSHNDSGECWLAGRDGRMNVEETIEALTFQAHMQAQVGADIVGPAAMIPGSIRQIRKMLDAGGYKNVGVMPHLIFESSLYEGYRASMGAVPRSGTRAFQISPDRPEDAVRVAQEMVDEGADMLLTEPALHTVDTLVHLADKVPVPLVPFSVSGEYLRLTDLREDGSRDMKGLIEAYTVLKRSGAARVISYGALEIARQLTAA
ncbi:hypothetical protein [Streptomyces sp. NPDC058861]|uniref:hypothetical protein n=1 Tax=Streptomyces sp. NPDC058861 TaxID=3346653 RepID=UPI00368E4DDD